MKEGELVPCVVCFRWSWACSIQYIHFGVFLWFLICIWVSEGLLWGCLGWWVHCFSYYLIVKSYFSYSVFKTSIAVTPQVIPLMWNPKAEEAPTHKRICPSLFNAKKTTTILHRTKEQCYISARCLVTSCPGNVIVGHEPVAGHLYS